MSRRFPHWISHSSGGQQLVTSSPAGDFDHATSGNSPRFGQAAFLTPSDGAIGFKLFEHRLRVMRRSL